MLRILVVDGDVQMGAAISGQLRKLGYGVVATSSGAQALRALEWFNPDIVFCDLELRGTTSPAAVQELKRLKPMTVCVGTFLRDAGPGIGRLAGADHFVVKPWDRAKVLKIIAGVEQRRFGATTLRSA